MFCTRARTILRRKQRLKPELIRAQLWLKPYPDTNWAFAECWVLVFADVAQLVEHSLGKGEVISSTLIIGSRN